MASFNRVILMGNLTQDIELRYTPGGTAVTDARMAVNNKRKNANNEWVDEVCYVSVTMWGRTAEVASEYLSKGSPVFVEGHLKYDSWETDGKKQSKLSVVCERMQMVGGKSGGGSGAAASQSYDKSTSARPAQVSESSSRQPAAASQNVAPQDTANQSAGRGDANPTGDGAGYDDTEIPF